MRLLAKFAAVIVGAVALSSGCSNGPDYDEIAMQNVMNRGATIVSEVGSSLRNSDLQSFPAYVDLNSMPMGAGPNLRAEILPWRTFDSGQSLDQVLQPPEDYRWPRREVVLLESAIGSEEFTGSVVLLVFGGYVESPSFDSSPHHYFYACLSLTLDLETDTVVSARAPCPVLPEALTDFSEPLPESKIRVGDLWPLAS